jgi:hypothetical protein
MTFEECYSDWPHEVTIETYAKCNAACVFCPYPTLERQGAKMSDEMIDRILGELKDHPYPFMIAPFKVNEPFLDKRLIPLCERINRELPNAWLRLFSNGSALTVKHIQGVAGLRQVRHLWISLNDHRPDEYQRIMSLDFKRTTGNLDMLHALMELGEFLHPVTVSKVMEGRIAGEIDREFAAYVHRRWPLFSSHLIKRDRWIDYLEDDGSEVPDTPCGRWYELNITAEGIVSLCCMDGTAEHPIGDLNTQTLQEVYAVQKRARAEKLSRKIVGGACGGCTY